MPNNHKVLLQGIDVVGTNITSQPYRPLEFTVIRLVVVNIDEKIGDSSISTIIELAADFITVIKSNCFDFNCN